MAVHKAILFLTPIIILSSVAYLYHLWTTETSLEIDSQSCVYPNLNLSPLAGQLIQCQMENDPTRTMQFTPCQSHQRCNFFLNRTYMVTERSLSDNCLFGVAQADVNVTPQEFEIDGTKIFYFYYENGEDLFCPVASARSLDLLFVCDPDANPYDPSLTYCGEYNGTGSCQYYMEIPTRFACGNISVCEWNAFSLESIRGYPITCNDQELVFSYEYTPCESFARCNNGEYQSVLFDRNTRECAYYLSEWDGGLIAPLYFNNQGNPSWIFNYQNGQQTLQCPQGVDFIIQWVCNQQCSPFCLQTECYQTGQCRHELIIQSVLACVEGEESEENNQRIMELLNITKLVTSNN